MVGRALSDSLSRLRPDVRLLTPSSQELDLRPVMKHLSHIAEGDFSNSDQLDRNGLFVGNHHIELGEEFELVAEALRAAMS